MFPLLLFSIIPGVIGFWLGFRASSRWPALFALGIGINALYLILILLAFGDLSPTANFWSVVSALPYWIFPYLGFLLAPFVVAAGVGRGLRNAAKPKRSNGR
jgi:hypothetical protein